MRPLRSPNRRCDLLPDGKAFLLRRGPNISLPPTPTSQLNSSRRNPSGRSVDLLQLVNTGHSGTISTVHANSASEGITRFTSCVLQSGVEIPYGAIKANIAESLDVVVHVERRPGQRRVAEVLALRGFDPDLDKYNFALVHQYPAERRHGQLTPEERQ